MVERPADAQRFVLDPDTVEQAGRSFQAMVEQRLCDAGRRLLGQSQSRQVAVGSSSGGVAFETRRSAVTVFDAVKDCCT
ncbi:MAG: hypothetical protein NZ518_03220, partial [Dehalococcoidia bacterium]|nr:hypothetical protein [Dehalococcoidia bacterium]